MKEQKKILLVEDDLDDQFFFIEAMKKVENAALYGIANNGQEALDKLQQAVVLPDIIFMDVNMQVMNGVDCLYFISNNPLLNHIPVIILTTNCFQKELLHTLGAKAFFIKPIKEETLSFQIKQMVNLDFNLESHIASQTFNTPCLHDFPNF